MPGTCRFHITKIKILDNNRDKLNDRQLKVILRMLQSPEDFEGGITAKKNIAITKTSKATATRDLFYLSDIKLLISFGAGRKVHYQVNL